MYQSPVSYPKIGEHIVVLQFFNKSISLFASIKRFFDKYFRLFQFNFLNLSLCSFYWKKMNTHPLNLVHGTHRSDCQFCIMKSFFIKFYTFPNQMIIGGFQLALSPDGTLQAIAASIIPIVVAFQANGKCRRCHCVSLISRPPPVFDGIA